MSHSIVKANDINEPIWQTLTNSVFPGAKDESIMMAVHYCEARGLDVLKKPVHIVPMNVKNSQTGRYEWRDIIMPGIAELRTTASRSSSYGGQSAPDFGEVKEYTIGKIKVEAPESCTVTVFKLINGQQVGFAHTEFFIEACATTKDGNLNSMWTKRPRGQLAKCAEAGALRKAFPEDLGGEISFDELPEGGHIGESPNGHPIIEQTITDEQAADVVTLLEEVNADRAKFAEWIQQNFKATSIKKIPADKLDEVIAALEAKKQQIEPEPPAETASSEEEVVY